MACNDCNDNNPCAEPCVDNNCYEDCGCMIETTFKCIHKPGTHAHLQVTNEMNGEETLAAINERVGELIAAIGQAGSGSGGSVTDQLVKVDADDTTPGFLFNKIEDGTFLKKQAVGSNKTLRLDVDMPTLVSVDAGNALQLDTKNKLFVKETPAAELHVNVNEATMTRTGAGTAQDPYIFSAKTIAPAKECYDGKWKDLNVGTITNSSVTYTGGKIQYRYTLDGSIQFRGNGNFAVQFGAYTTAERKQVVTLAELPSTCFSATEQSGQVDLKNITHIDVPNGTLVQQFGYTIRKNGTNLLIEFQSAYASPGSKTIVVSFDGAISHPAI